ncbi:hypothetical protein BC938DRAFT_470557 [Jimgerdemannia flammicorona]|uniref:Uncharacterized protein n=1 Tax=Jimgerdemannia flammicorona TaxID=994334 RepID=A0A433Q9U6_9FUNG|nr:hypothetical protein BC938DRAFT_470557 [Jimgerdemannia flammicorona]
MKLHFGAEMKVPHLISSTVPMFEELRGVTSASENSVRQYICRNGSADKEIYAHLHTPWPQHFRDHIQRLSVASNLDGGCRWRELESHYFGHSKISMILLH